MYEIEKNRGQVSQVWHDKYIFCLKAWIITPFTYNSDVTMRTPFFYLHWTGKKSYGIIQFGPKHGISRCGKNQYRQLPLCCCWWKASSQLANFKFVSDVANEATTVKKRQRILKRDIKQHLVNQPRHLLFYYLALERFWSFNSIDQTISFQLWLLWVMSSVNEAGPEALGKMTITSYIHLSF